MQPGLRWALERELPRKRRDGDTVTARAEVFAVACRAEVTRGGGAHAVLTNEVAFVKDMARRPGELCGQIDVAPVTLPSVPLILVGVAAEALCHRRSKARLVRSSRGGMAGHALTTELWDVRVVSEAQVFPRQAILFARMRLAVAPVARPRVVRLRMARRADVLLGQMERAIFGRSSDVLMTAEAVDPRVRVGSVLERMLPIFRFDPEEPRARRERDGQDEQRHTS